MERRRLDARGLAGLIRPRIAVLVLVVTAVGYLLESPADLSPLPWLLTGMLLSAAAGCALNHWAERDIDAAMERTRERPLVTGALTPGQVFWGAVVALVSGLALLLVGAGAPAAGLQALALFIYLGVYTPLKRRTSSNTWVGALPGALPLLVGAVAAAGSPSLLSWIAFGLLFLWQLPHFFAIASMYRDDYVSGGLRMLSGEDPDDALLRWQMPLQVMSVMLLSFMPTVLGLTGPAYATVALLVGAVFLASAFAFRRHPDRARARGVVLASVTYLPLVMGALVLDVACGPAGDHDLAAGGGAGTSEVPCAICAEGLAEGEACEVCGLDGELAVVACELCDDPDELAAADGHGDVDVDALAAGHDDDEDEDDEDDDELDGADDLLSRLADLSGSSALPEVDDGTGLPNFGALPAFALIGDDGQPFANRELMGSAWVVDFIFTTCAGPCPVMSQKFVELEGQGIEAKFLSITVDPRRDGPEQLRAYRARHGGSAETWRLLTGGHREIQSLAEAGFRLPVNSGSEAVSGMAPMFHSGKFALLDTEARVRGYYDYRDRLEMEALLKDAAALADAAGADE